MFRDMLVSRIKSVNLTNGLGIFHTDQSDTRNVDGSETTYTTKQIVRFGTNPYKAALFLFQRHLYEIGLGFNI